MMLLFVNVCSCVVGRLLMRVAGGDWMLLMGHCLCVWWVVVVWVHVCLLFVVVCDCLFLLWVVVVVSML